MVKEVDITNGKKADKQTDNHMNKPGNVSRKSKTYIIQF